MFDLGTIEASPAKLRDGVWYEIWFTPDKAIDGKPIPQQSPDKPCVLVVPKGIAHERVREEEQRPLLDKLRAGTATDDEIRAIAGRVLARTVFRGCANISIAGELVVWSEAKAVELMTDQRWIRLREFVEAASVNRAGTAAREEEQAVKN